MDGPLGPSPLLRRGPAGVDTRSVRSSSFVKRVRAACPALLVLLVLAACGSATGTGVSNPSPSRGQLRLAGDAENGTTVNLHVGDRLALTLHSTYWTISGSTNSRVLTAEGPEAVSPAPGGCVPGGGCGTVTMTFDVIGTGSADVTASRVSCGEAMLCTGTQGSYKITVAST